jgi:N6-L-threonylcarbamoyladenine synthase
MILANVVSSQVAVHRPYGGVVPELASRHHLANIVPVVQQAMSEAQLGFSDLDGIAVTVGPGLVGALLIGVQLAKGIAYVTGKPLIGVNHLEGHLCSSYLAGDPPPARHVALLVSGGHTALVLVEAFGQYRPLSATRDDAAGEAFDKVAKLLGLGYPGGPLIESLARQGDGQAIQLPRPMSRRADLDFSFSGLKTAVANHVRRSGRPMGQELADLCASFQQAVIDVLVQKTLSAAREQRVRAIVAAGGVMANQAVRQALDRATREKGLDLHVPPATLCTDNAVMIAAAGRRRLVRGERDNFGLSVRARWPFAPQAEP